MTTNASVSKNKTFSAWVRVTHLKPTSDVTELKRAPGKPKAKHVASFIEERDGRKAMRRVLLGLVVAVAVIVLHQDASGGTRVNVMFRIQPKSESSEW